MRGSSKLPKKRNHLPLETGNLGCRVPLDEGSLVLPRGVGRKKGDEKGDRTEER